MRGSCYIRELLGRLAFLKENLVYSLVSRSCLWSAGACTPQMSHLLWVEVLRWTWKLTGILLDLHEDSVAMLLFLLTLLSLGS